MSRPRHSERSYGQRVTVRLLLVVRSLLSSTSRSAAPRMKPACTWHEGALQLPFRNAQAFDHRTFACGVRSAGFALPGLNLEFDCYKARRWRMAARLEPGPHAEVPLAAGHDVCLVGVRPGAHWQFAGHEPVTAGVAVTLVGIPGDVRLSMAERQPMARLVQQQVVRWVAVHEEEHGLIEAS